MKFEKLLLTLCRKKYLWVCMYFVWMRMRFGSAKAKYSRPKSMFERIHSGPKSQKKFNLGGKTSKYYTFFPFLVKYEKVCLKESFWQKRNQELSSHKRTNDPFQIIHLIGICLEVKYDDFSFRIELYICIKSELKKKSTTPSINKGY